MRFSGAKPCDLAGRMENDMFTVGSSFVEADCINTVRQINIQLAELSLCQLWNTDQIWD